MALPLLVPLRARAIRVASACGSWRGSSASGARQSGASCLAGDYALNDHGATPVFLTMAQPMVRLTS
jgi:hypothetical protein